jgi:hypothetical protein
MCYGSYTELKLTERKARKEYRCAWCNEKIVIGEKHTHRVYIFEGDFSSDRMHNECFIAMGKADHEDVCEGFMFGEFHRGDTKSKYND